VPRERQNVPRPSALSKDRAYWTRARSRRSIGMNDVACCRTASLPFGISAPLNGGPAKNGTAPWNQIPSRPLSFADD
jgi:hypothetical protein